MPKLTINQKISKCIESECKYFIDFRQVNNQVNAVKCGRLLNEKFERIDLCLKWKEYSK